MNRHFRRSMWLVPLVLVMPLTACGGGSSGGGGGVVSTPAPSYTKIVDMTGNRSFQTAGVSYNTSAAGISSPAVQAFGSGVTVAYTASSDSYTLTAPGGATQSFSPAELQPQNPSTPNLIQYAKTVGTTRDLLSLIAPTSGGVPLSYTVVGTWGTADLTAGTAVFRVAIGGSPTLNSDMPKSGTATYTVGVGGSALDRSGASPVNYTLAGNSSGTFSANFATGAISTSLTLAGTASPSGTTVQPLGTFTGTGSLGSGGPGFSGTLSGTGANGVFSGLFLGPQALEMGFGYALSGATFSAAGAVTGVKQ